MTDQRLLIPYYREIRSARGCVSPSVDVQREWVRQRAAAHPFAAVSDVGREIETRYEGPGTPEANRQPRPKLREVLKAAADNGNSIILLPSMPKHYRYQWIADEIEQQRVPWLEIHPQKRAGRPASRKDHGKDVRLGEAIPIHGGEFNAVWKEIKRNCGWFIRSVERLNSKLLFRGTGERDHGPAFVGRPKVERRPKSSGLVNHRYAIDWMKEHGFAAHRGNSVICTSNPEHARAYSDIKQGKWRKIYAIFPFDGFDFTWSRNEREFAYVVSEEDGTLPFYDGDVDPPKGLKNRGWNPFLEDRLWSADYVSNDIDGALRAEHEIMISGVPYYGLDWSTYRTAVLKKLGFKLQNEPYTKRR
ncbi:protein of unknown function [Magnetospirillum gryphiswaldense MSR-1 v2]|uniref:Uncharacterized protein n=1 Tax=Magnetospirillum gryphiswaldense (strain DSM 6361 / JCM 21280 / NBRC 15271 / MSR-1) TaxID=431944 RepID=V6F7F8_MAGGM|nr:hypothetical protein [Magnetospirillum gryphiswaldense]CDL00256.1 protein of unknown function [Magnetospirillum gryphiswaldense MSR-1 v2]